MRSTDLMNLELLKLEVTEVFGRSLVIRVSGILNLESGRQMATEVGMMMEDRPGHCVILDCDGLVDVCTTAQRYELAVRMSLTGCRWILVGGSKELVAMADSLVAFSHMAGVWIEQAQSLCVAKLLVGLE